MDDSHDDIDDESGGYFSDDDSLVVVDVWHVVKSGRDGHGVGLERKTFCYINKMYSLGGFLLGNIKEVWEIKYTIIK